MARRQFPSNSKYELRVVISLSFLVTAPTTCAFIV
jgi:hypothetical protein